jgi:hypothetical protein
MGEKFNSKVFCFLIDVMFLISYFVYEFSKWFSKISS